MFVKPCQEYFFPPVVSGVISMAPLPKIVAKPLSVRRRLPIRFIISLCSQVSSLSSAVTLRTTSSKDG